MAFPAMNQEVANVTLFNFNTGATPAAFLQLGQYPMFRTQRPVDVSGMEMAVANLKSGATGLGQAIATGASTIILIPYDGGTSASVASGGTQLYATTVFINTASAATGVSSWEPAHGMISAQATSTTDLDADDWVNLNVAANLDTSAGLGIIVCQAEFIYGVPGGPA